MSEVNLPEKARLGSASRDSMIIPASVKAKNDAFEFFNFISNAHADYMHVVTFDVPLQRMLLPYQTWTKDD